MIDYRGFIIGQGEIDDVKWKYYIANKHSGFLLKDLRIAASTEYGSPNEGWYDSLETAKAMVDAFRTFFPEDNNEFVLIGAL